MSTQEGMELLCTLKDMPVHIWRLIQIDPDTPLSHLHTILQTAFGWSDKHLYEFRIDDRLFAPPDPFMEDFSRQPESMATPLKSLITDKTREMIYTYDFGDNWTVSIRLERFLEIRPSAPRIIMGENAGPPEDCGGAPGFEDLLFVLSDETDPDYEMLSQWAGDGFDPEFCDIEGMNEKLKKLH